MKKILFILPSLTIGGLERVQVTIANALARKGYDVTILTLNPQCDLASELDNGIRWIYKPYKEHKLMRRIPYIRHKLYDDGMWEKRASAKKLYKYYVGKEKFDVEIGFFRGLPIKLVSGSTNKSSVKLAWVHSDFKHCKGISSSFKDMNAVKAAYEKFDKIICVSEQARGSFIETIGCKEKCCTVYNMISVQEICEKAKKEVIEKYRFTILSVGRLVEPKAYARLLEAVKRLNQDGFDFELWIVGDGGDRQKLNEIIEKNALANVKLLGAQRNPYKYIKQADLYVCSSLYEGYNLTVAEALILGVPVISTKCAGPCEILDNGKYGMLVENSEDGLYEGIKALLTDGGLLTEYKEKAKQRRDFFDEEKLVGQIIRCFDKVE